MKTNCFWRDGALKKKNSCTFQLSSHAAVTQMFVNSEKYVSMNMFKMLCLKTYLLLYTINLKTYLFYKYILFELKKLPIKIIFISIIFFSVMGILVVCICVCVYMRRRVRDNKFFIFFKSRLCVNKF